jgi:5'-3' exonuclease
MCILSGCDYLKNIPSLGIAWAYKVVHDYASLVDIFDAIKNKQNSNGQNKYEIPMNYIREFGKAVNTFKYQLIFDVEENTQRRYNSISDLDMNYAGKYRFLLGKLILKF